jgi:DNA-binding transcriptional MerR regulator
MVQVQSRVMIGAMAIRSGVTEGHLRRLARAHLIPHERAGRYFVFSPADAQEIRRIALEKGLVKEGVSAAIA